GRPAGEWSMGVSWLWLDRAGNLIFNQHSLIKGDQVFHISSDFVRGAVICLYRVLPPVHLVHYPAGSAVLHVDAGADGKGHVKCPYRSCLGKLQAFDGGDS